MFVLILLLALSTTIWVYWLKIVNSGWGPMIKGSLPIIGYTHKMMGNTEKLYQVIEDMASDSLANGGVVRLIIAMQTYYVVTDPDDITTCGNNCLKKHFSFDFAQAWLGNGLLTGEPSVWKRHRKLLNPAFSLPLLQGFMKVFNEQGRKLVHNLAPYLDKGQVDISEYLKENVISSLNQTVLGLPNSKKVADLFQKYLPAADKILELIVERFQNAWLHSDLIFKLTGYRKREKELINDMNELSDLVIKTRKTQIKQENYDNPNINGSKNKPFMDLLLELLSKNILTESEVREEVDTMLIAGSDTTLWGIIYVCNVLGTYPHVQQKVVNELTRIFGDSDRDLKKEDLQKMVYTEAVLKETLRLYPVGPISVRTVESAVKLKNFTLRPGDHVFMSFLGLNRHPTWGPDANQFRPERWLETDTLPTVYGGFGIGKRSCLGKTYVTIAMKTTLAHVLRHYRLSADVTKLKFKMDFIAKPISGHHIAVSERIPRFHNISYEA